MNGSVWIASYVLLWIAVVVLGFSVVALLRQVGVLHLRVAPMGVHFAGEGPELDQPAPEIDLTTYDQADVTLLAFTSPSCEICESLKPDLARLDRAYDEVRLRIVDHDRSPGTFTNFKVRSTPYLVAIDRDGLVRSRGVANTIDQVEEMLAEVLAGPPTANTAEVGS
jgi:thiol-disulfide isomerase/thioredoxin